ncbi:MULTISPECIES: ABC transporter ATP-binding protein [unclassified Beijerinckia]|uniref:ABC transporter ATP-binding protein n=1 Tax=unclassified Beijerinckia TaxID=2638183 RepID=UPI00089CDBAA|nr:MULTISPECIES: ABC transporter ATP-binding protein [unclassified Beijerinckia]MDH7798740.1 branched-chain amino acid transport system ATP-binding protein [Beijerinckia sp. GAS462]SED31470.1 amino acid/amide ABC transporter ATP-binding protein 1, HAAT family [Beijerinckia sp. 28-YEA-48]
MSKAPLLRVAGLSKRFGGLTAVEDLSFDVGHGEILALIGPNGAGKTTTFNLVTGMLAPSSGQIELDGQRIDGLPVHRIASKGMLRTFQHNMPFAGMSLTDNVMVGAHRRFSASVLDILLQRARVLQEEKQARARAAELVEFVGLGHHLHADVTTLSFGEGRLLEIARALAGDPRAILLDEPAAGLTAAEISRLGTLIRTIAAEGVSVLLIEHDMHFLMPLAERIVVLNFGRKIGEGTSQEITANAAVIEAYLGSAVNELPSGGAHV